jgi:molybdopterin converting factor small subunit
MCRISFTDNLKRHVACPPQDVQGDTVRAVLEAVFADNPALREYIFDDQSRLRRHVTVFINDRMIKDREGLAEPVGGDDELFVFQALSGG